ncbi:MAG: DUF721 domain-containing protein [Candidatus Sericytochromatia bacterium]|nr:DUF721 domain-containing protein [Candidatus Sericytochromatia bacterium]
MARPEKLADALGKALPGMDLAQRQRESVAMALWPEVVGPTTAAKTRPLHVNRGVMSVKVISAPWAHQLNLMKPQLLKSLAARVGRGVIEDLRWRVGALTTGADEPSQEPHSPHTRRLRQALASLASLPPATIRAVEVQVAPISDPQVARRVRDVLLRQRQHQQALLQAGWKPCQRCGALHAGDDARTPAHCPPCALLH